MQAEKMSDITVSRERFEHRNKEDYEYRLEPGLSEEVVREISRQKNEPDWMLSKRLYALDVFRKMPLPKWGPDLSRLDLNKIIYFIRPKGRRNATSWDEVPEDIKRTFERLGIPKAEQFSLSGVGAQYESEVIYHNLKKEWESKGVIFIDCDVALQRYPDIFREHFMTRCVTVQDHKFAALHCAVWSGGTFLYVPAGVKVTIPLQAYFRMNAQGMGQFEHTLIIVEEGAEVHYIEGCSAPLYNTSSIHAGCVEIFVKSGARVRYSSVENWSKNTFNLNTKRAIVEENASIDWVGGNLGSGVTMLYPCSILRGRNARANHLGIAFASSGQNQDVGAKVYHLASDTSSIVRSKSICLDGGITTYRGMVHVRNGAKNTRCSVRCDALIMDERSGSNTYPLMDVQEIDAEIVHEATVGRINPNQIFYLMSRGISEEQAIQMIVSGFIEPIIRELPLEYAVEMNRLIQMEMEGRVG